MVGIVMPRHPYVGMHKIGDFKKLIYIIFVELL